MYFNTYEYTSDHTYETTYDHTYEDTTENTSEHTYDHSKLKLRKLWANELAAVLCLVVFCEEKTLVNGQ